MAKICQKLATSHFGGIVDLLGGGSVCPVCGCVHLHDSRVVACHLALSQVILFPNGKCYEDFYRCDVLSLKAAAERLGLSQAAVKRLVAQGRLPNRCKSHGLRSGEFFSVDIEAYERVVEAEKALDVVKQKTVDLDRIESACQLVCFRRVQLQLGLRDVA